MTDKCEVCKDAEKLVYTVTRHGLKEDYRKQTTYSGVANYCPRCGRHVAPWVREHP